jgi:hypothetical protein
LRRFFGTIPFPHESAGIDDGKKQQDQKRQHQREFRSAGGVRISQEM